MGAMILKFIYCFKFIDVLSSIYILLFLCAIYIREKKKEKEIEEGMELVFNGTLDGTHRVKRFYM